MVGNIVQGNRLASAQGRDMGVLDEDSDSAKKVSICHVTRSSTFRTFHLRQYSLELSLSFVFTFHYAMIYAITTGRFELLVYHFY